MPPNSTRRQLNLLRVYATFTYPFACMPFLYFFFADHGIDLSDYSWLISVYYGTMVAAEVPTGIISDRCGRVLPAVLGPCTLAAGFIAIGCGDSFAAFAIGQAALGLGHSLLSGPPSAILFETLRRDRRATEFLHQESTLHGLRLLGTGLSFLLGGIIASLFGYGACILVTAPLCLVAAITAAFLRNPGRRRASSRRVPIVASAVRDLRKPAIAWIVAYYVILFCLLRYPFHFYQPFLREAGHDSPLFVGSLFFALNLVAAPCSRISPWLRQTCGERTIFWLMPLTISSSLWLMSTQPNGLGIALIFAHQVPFGLHWAMVQDFVNHRLRDASRATVLSTLSLAGRLAFLVVLQLVAALSSDTVSAFAVVGSGGSVVVLLCLIAGHRFLGRRRAGTDQ